MLEMRMVISGYISILQLQGRQEELEGRRTWRATSQMLGQVSAARGQRKTLLDKAVLL